MSDLGGSMYSEGADRAIRIASLAAIPVFVCYNLAIMGGLIPSDHLVGTIPASLISAGWVIMGALSYFSTSASPRSVAIRLIGHHVFALATLVAITGFLSPFAPAIAILFLASHFFFGWTALSLSVASVIVAATIDAVVRMPFQSGVAIENALGVIGIVTLGAVLVAIITAQETRRQTLVRSQARERLEYERTTTIINNLAEATFSVDNNGHVLIYNAACLDLLDTNDSLRGIPIAKLFNLTLADKTTVDLFDELKKATRATNRDDLVHTYADGEQVKLEMTYAPIKHSYSRRRKSSPRGDGYILIVRDITKRKSLEEERDEFISVVSHELRTPITIVEGTVSNLDVLMSRPETPDKKMLHEMVTTAHEQILYLAKMVNDLSTLSRAERGVGDSAELIDVTQLLQDMHARYEKEAGERKLQLNLDCDTHLGSILASRLYTEELLQNFTTNALKYTKTGSVTIIGKRNDDHVRFTVKDTGIGISRSDQAKVFDKFYRSEDYRIRETGGTGLGLYVSAKLAHKLSTHIELVSRLNHGSSFSFELPIAETGPSK